MTTQYAPLDFQRYATEHMLKRAIEFSQTMQRRRSVRSFSAEPVPTAVVKRAICTATQAPSGANQQPWTFVLVADPKVKQRIRLAVEEAEKKFYSSGPDSWLQDLAPLGTDASKPYLQSAPLLIAVFRQATAADGGKHYYARESVGIACGFLIAALHWSGLVTLPMTPSAGTGLRQILQRPPNERSFLLLPVGYPEVDCRVPDIHRKPTSEVLVEML